MKEMNNRGFTIIEIIMSFSLIMILCVGLFLTATNYKNKQQLESSKRALQTYKTTLTADIQKDITEKGLKEIKTCTSINNNCYELVFYDSTSKKIQKSLDKSILYGNVNYSVKEQSLTNIGKITLKQTTKNFTSFSTGKSTIYKLTIEINHQEINDNYNIEIVASSFKNQES